MTAASLPTGAWSNRPRALLWLGLFWAAEALLGLGMGLALLAEAKAMPAWMLAVAVPMAAFLAAIGLRLSVWCLRQLGRAGIVLAIGPDGYLDRRLCPEPLPWSEITRVDVYYTRGVQVMFDLTPAGDRRVHRFDRAMARLNRLVGLPGYAISRMGTDAPDVAVARAMQAWHATTRGTGADPA